MTGPIHITRPKRIAVLLGVRDRHCGDESAIRRVRPLASPQTLNHYTTFEASRYLDLHDPRARKLELVKRGHEILTTWRLVVTESGERHRIGAYSLVGG